MPLTLSDTAMLRWLKSQICILEAWREEMARQPSIDIAAVQRLERHYQWLSSEVSRLDQGQAA